MEEASVYKWRDFVQAIGEVKTPAFYHAQRTRVLSESIRDSFGCNHKKSTRVVFRFPPPPVPGGE